MYQTVVCRVLLGCDYNTVMICFNYVVESAEWSKYKMFGLTLWKQSHCTKATHYRHFPITSESISKTLPPQIVNDVIHLMASLNVIIKYQVLSQDNYLISSILPATNFEHKEEEYSLSLHCDSKGENCPLKHGNYTST